MTFELKDLPPWVLASVAIGSAVGAIIFGWMRDRFGRDFARAADVAALSSRVQADVAGLSSRVQAVETRIATMPDHGDIQLLTARVAAVEGGVGVVAEKARGIEAALGRVEHAVDLLVQHQITKASG